jgi:hypothetical protein
LPATTAIDGDVMRIVGVEVMKRRGDLEPARAMQRAPASTAATVINRRLARDRLP